MYLDAMKAWPTRWRQGPKGTLHAFGIREGKSAMFFAPSRSQLLPGPSNKDPTGNKPRGPPGPLNRFAGLFHDLVSHRPIS